MKIIRTVSAAILLLLSFSPSLFSQPEEPATPDDYLTSQFHANRRAALRNLMPENSVAIFFSAPERNRSNDVDFSFSQDPNFYYLSGLKEPNSLLLICKNKIKIGNTTSNEFIFVQERNPSQEMWTGELLGTEGVKKSLGFEAVFLNKVFDTIQIKFAELRKISIIDPVDLSSEPTSARGSLGYLVEQTKLKLAGLEGKIDRLDIGKWMTALRVIKQPEEIALLQKAIDISCKGHLELMRAVHPGMQEYQAQAVMEYFFKEGGSEYPGYPSIVGSGKNSCILHYETNNKKMFVNELVLADCGAEYHGYSADVTRTMPVNGKFSDEQRAIYQLVYDAQLAGINSCKPGNYFFEPHKAAAEVIMNGLIKLGITTSKEEYKNYFTHFTSHFLGLNVHDVGLFGKLETGNVLTVEPGIYIPEGSPCDKKWWNIGVRIEDDILITENGNKVMSDSAPKAIAEIEKVIAEKSMFEK